jgi:NAD(P)H dehydrogenase (quinone)
MSTQRFLVIGATGKTGRHTVHHLLEGGHVVRAMVHKEDERSEALRSAGAEVVIGELLEHDDAVRAAAGTGGAYFCYPVSPGLIQATAYFAEAAKRAALKVIVNMSQISAREDSKSHAARDHWIAERLFDWSGVPTVHIRPTFFSEWLLFPFVRSTIVKNGIIDLPYGNGRHAPIAGEDQARGYRDHPYGASCSYRQDLYPLRTVSTGSGRNRRDHDRSAGQENQLPADDHSSISRTSREGGFT